MTQTRALPSTWWRRASPSADMCLATVLLLLSGSLEDRTIMYVSLRLLLDEGLLFTINSCIYWNSRTNRITLTRSSVLASY
jgi:hypothetical protein